MRVETFGKELKTASREGPLFNVIPAKKTPWREALAGLADFKDAPRQEKRPPKDIAPPHGLPDQVRQ